MNTHYLRQEIDINDASVVSAFDQASIWSMEFGRFMLRHLELRPGIQGLDLGCGTGYPLLELAHAHGSSSHFTGVDIWGTAVARAREKIPVYRLPNVRLIEPAGDRLPMDSESIDLVTGNLVLNNLERPDITLAECARVAKPGARIVMTTNLTGHMEEFYQVFESLLCERADAAALSRLTSHIAHRGTVATHCASLEQAGFTICRSIEDSWELRFLDGSSFLRSWFIGCGFLPSWKGIPAPEDLESVFIALEQRLNAVSERDGELRLTIPMVFIEGIKPSSRSPITGVPKCDDKDPDFRESETFPLPSEGSEPEFQQLDPRHVGLQRISGGIVAGLVSIVAPIVSGVAGLAMSSTLAWGWVVGGWILAVLGLGTIAWIWPGIAHRHARWRLDEIGLEIHRGVLWRHQISVPLARLQHADIAQGPLQRKFGLAKLIVHTAGTRDASVELGGLAEATATWLRDQLIRQKEAIDVV